MKPFEGVPYRAATWVEIVNLGSWLKLQIGQDAATAVALDDVDSSDGDGLDRVHDDVVAAHMDANERVLRVVELCAAPTAGYGQPDSPAQARPTDSAQRRRNFAELQRMAQQYRGKDGWRAEWGSDTPGGSQ